MFYIHRAACISPQQTFNTIDIEQLNNAVDGKLVAIEPAYEGIPQSIFRRMGKAVRMGIGAALPLLKNITQPAGIIIGTANGGKEDCVKFMNQIVDYQEGLLTPINFVQSTPNATAAQIGLLTKNYGYNITHVHLGLAFEFALTDAAMMVAENLEDNYLVGAVDDISTFNYNFDEKSGCHKKEQTDTKDLYKVNSPGSIAGEAAAMFIVNGIKKDALLKVIAVDTLHSENIDDLRKKLTQFIHTNLPAGEEIDLLLSGENGDNRLLNYYTCCESLLKNDTGVARFKHMSGEFLTATAMGLWLCCEILQQQKMPLHMIKKPGTKTSFKNIFIYNNCKGLQHSFILVAGNF